MDVDPSWTFDEYQAYERTRLNESLAEQARAHANGLEVDPKSEPPGKAKGDSKSDGHQESDSAKGSKPAKPRGRQTP